MLTLKEVAHYREVGQVTPAYRLSDAVISTIEAKAEALFASRPDLDQDYAPNLIATNAGWLDFAIQAENLDSVAQLIGEDIIVWGSAFFCKKGIGGKKTPWHQDAAYWPIVPMAASTVWIAFDHSTPDNGCMRAGARHGVVPRPFTLHGAEPNNSGARRGGLTFRYMPTTSYWDRELEVPEIQGKAYIRTRQLHLVRGVDVCGQNDIYRAVA
jgi:hypothetical protein